MTLSLIDIIVLQTLSDGFRDSASRQATERAVKQGLADAGLTREPEQLTNGRASAPVARQFRHMTGGAK